MNNYIENSPSADVLINSMRAMGYSFESAIADVVDNSVSVKASVIEIKFPIDPSDCYVAICDNGTGMSRDRLIEAMRYGSKPNGEERDADDLGRFGLGLKSASLSQCRKLTVASKKDGNISALVWDLDVIGDKQGWYMVECTEEQIRNIKCISFLDDYDCGTVVLWEEFDVIEKSAGNVYAELNRLQDITADYLSLIFHRYISREGTAKVTIKVNKFTLKGMDPFLENHKKTNVRRRIEIPIADSQGVERFISVQPYILPFQKDLAEEDKKISGGIENYRSKQGFYIYRNERLIIWGTWFGRPRDELTKYARIKVDIPNTLDDIWNIDIKKQNATIPPRIRTRLNRAVDEAMDLAVRAQTYRGRIDKVDEKIDYIWLPIKTREEQHTFRINRDSKIFDLIRSKVDDETWSRIDMVLEEIEESLPYQQIYIDKAQNKIDDVISDERLAEIEAKAQILISIALVAGGESRETVVDRLFQSEPFNKYPAIKSKLMEN